MVLPSSDGELKSYVHENKLKMMDSVVNSIQHSVENDLTVIEVFKFKNSDFVITLDKNNFLSNMEQIYSYCMENEYYELCSKIKKVNVRLLKTI